MGLIELANQLSMDKGLCSRLVKKGMPTSSADSANAWRAIHAKPRAKRSGTTPAPLTAVNKPTRASAPAVETIVSNLSTMVDKPTSEAADDPAESLRRARQTEKQSFKKLEQLQKDRLATPEDLRKSSSVYFAARNNRARAEADHREHLRAEQVTLFYDEAVEIASRPHLAIANLLREGPKMLVPRLHGMPSKSQEKTLADFFDGIAAQLRQSF